MLTDKQIREHVAQLMIQSAIREENAGYKTRSESLFRDALLVVDGTSGTPHELTKARYVALSFAARAAQDLFGVGDEGFQRVKQAI